jgi:Phage integrase family
VITRKGGKVVTIPLAPRTARAIDLTIGERTGGPLFVTADGKRLDRHGAARVVRRVTRRAGITKQVSPHTLRHAFITAALDAGVPLRDVQEAASHADPHHHALRPRPNQLGPALPTPSPPTSPEQPDSPQPGLAASHRRPDRPRLEATPFTATRRGRKQGTGTAVLSGQAASAVTS